MTTIVFSNQPSIRSAKIDPKSKLIVSLDMSDERDKFAYRFTENEIIIDKPSRVLTIDLESRLPSGYIVYIDSFVRTHHPLIQPMTKTIDGRFDEGTQQVRFSINMKIHEFLFLGIIVGIKEKSSDSQYKFILCDPQVGNGPPNSGKAALTI